MGIAGGKEGGGRGEGRGEEFDKPIILLGLPKEKSRGGELHH